MYVAFFVAPSVDVTEYLTACFVNQSLIFLSELRTPRTLAAEHLWRQQLQKLRLRRKIEAKEKKGLPDKEVEDRWPSSCCPGSNFDQAAAERPS